MKYFFAGIEGSGMAALASMLYDMGNEVIGCDDAKVYSFTLEELNKRNICVYKDASMLTSDMIYVYSAAIHEDHYSYEKAVLLGCKMYGYYEMIGELTKKYDAICISGTHGKTTTTAMLSNILKNTIGTSYLIGDGTGYVDKDSNNFVVESCEFDRHFLAYYPKYTVITNIFYDHVDCYNNIDEIVDVFQKLVDKTEFKTIACGDNLNVRKLHGDIVYYGFEDNNDIRAVITDFNSDGSCFDVYINNEFFGHFNLNIYGKHMILDALACIAVSYYEGVSIDDMIKYLNGFGGAKRRFSEERVGDVILVDDYAHHPNEVLTVLKTARQKYPDKELVPVLVPYTISRTQAFYKDFAKVLKEADKVYVTDIEPARESFSDYPGVSSKLIIDEIPNAEHISSETISKLYKHKNAVIPFMGCKDPTWLIDAYKEGLKDENA
ncbi:MAG: Mur ligase family protein [bacterium]|nr:Mur ligase family protein [bacterium]